MTPLDGLPILTAAQMRAAEDDAIADGATVDGLMARAGPAIAEQVRRLASGAEVLVLCGPGNNGGDGYVAAATLAANGHPVRVAALADPRTPAAIDARARWSGPVEPLGGCTPAPVLVDALFGTGASRPLDAASRAALTAADTRLAIAVDLPSGVATDTGAALGPDAIRRFDVTLALGALKPAHLLQPAAAWCGAVRVLDIGVPISPTSLSVLAQPSLAAPGPDSHKFNRGMVAVVAGAMHGACELAARAAYRAGAGYVVLLTGGLPQPPHAIVRRAWRADSLADPRIGAVVIGPGLGRDDRAREKLDAALASDRPLVIDGDALHLLDPARLRERAAPSILTPHAGEFAALFGEGADSKIDRTRAAAAQAGAVVVFKGADTVIAAPDGNAWIALAASSWLSVAGTGDVLAGAVGALLARGELAPLDAAAAAVWLHGAAARRFDRCFLADDLADALPAALAAATVGYR